MNIRIYHTLYRYIRITQLYAIQKKTYTYNVFQISFSIMFQEIRTWPSGRWNGEEVEAVDPAPWVQWCTMVMFWYNPTSRPTDYNNNSTLQIHFPQHVKNVRILAVINGLIKTIIGGPTYTYYIGGTVTNLQNKPFTCTLLSA